MTLRRRLAVTFAFVALVTAAAIAVATPVIVGRGFSMIEGADDAHPGQGGGQGQMSRLRAHEVQQETVIAMIVVALLAAGGATLIGIVLAGRIAEPLGRLGSAAAAVARGDLTQRSGLAGRSDEIGDLGRSFDAMASDLAQADASRRRFLQDAAHELKTPLTVIDATTSAVLEGVYAHEDRHLETIRDQSRLLGRIVDDLRVITLADAGQLPLHREPVAIVDLVARVATAFAARANAGGLLLDQDVADGLVVQADPDRLEQVLGALVDNALRHTPTGGRVGVEAHQAVSGVRVSVTDTGPGISPADLPHVFERFYQADPARDRSTGSSGLGLSIVKAIIEAHRGRVGAEDLPGGGARFWFELG